MVYRDLDKYHQRKKYERERKLDIIKDQVLNGFFSAYPPAMIKAKIKEGIANDRIPTFSLFFKLREAFEDVDETKYIELVEDNDCRFLLVDGDFHNIKKAITTSSYYRHYRKQLKCDYQFIIDGRTEDGTITIQFYKQYGSFLSNFFN